MTEWIAAIAFIVAGLLIAIGARRLWRHYHRHPHKE